VFTLAELEGIAAVVKRHEHVTVVSDEVRRPCCSALDCRLCSTLHACARACVPQVYEYLTYDSALPHVRIATLPGMWERCVTVCSSGKTFSVTGWKCGWVIGPKHLVGYVNACDGCF
jgi:aspartate/methionine/tyrosine aminotransferase